MNARVALILLAAAGSAELHAATPPEANTAAVRLFDTGTHSSTPLSGATLGRQAGWIEVAEDVLDHPFRGDAVLLNDRIAVVLRREARGAEVYSIHPQRLALRALLAPAAEVASPILSALTVVEHHPGAGAVKAVFAAGNRLTLTVRYTLQAGQPIVQTEALEGATGLHLEAPCRFAVLPDFFADDIVVDAAELPVAAAELPSDNFLLHLLPGGEAIVMTVVKTSDADSRIVLSGKGGQRRIDRSELRFGQEGKIWTAVLSAPAIWHCREIAREEAGQIVRLDWKPPFPAHWRVDWQRPEKVTDSWTMLNGQTDGRFAKPGLFRGPDALPADRNRWTTVLGRFSYPAWIAPNGWGYLQPLKSSALRFQGPAILYPLSRVADTGLEQFTVLDIVRNTLGVGPCEYILDVEGQQSQYRGRATCSVRDTLNPIYARQEQKQRQAEIEKVLGDLMIFLRHIRGRIETYVAFGHETLAYLADQKTAHPELAEPLSQLEALSRRIDERVADRQDKIQTLDRAAAMVEEFRRTVLGHEDAAASARCQQFTKAWVEIGGNQDELVGECRWAVKMIRQRAGLLMAQDPRLAETANEIRRRSQLVLRRPANHEGARH